MNIKQLKKIENLHALIRIQKLQDLCEIKINKSKSKTNKKILNAEFQVLTDCEFILKYTSCYTKKGFNLKKYEQLHKSTFVDSNQRFIINENRNRN